MRQYLRRLERNGLPARHVIAIFPVAVAYGIIALGRALLPPFKTFHARTMQNLDAVEATRTRFDKRAGSGRLLDRTGGVAPFLDMIMERRGTSSRNKTGAP
ncbi:hypothetical protein [Jiella mangrovi]|uniref:hypothetical protein n=1 Tax=Jiella mangrovi TaxID=2821407 RepID=UPI003CC91C7F